MAHPKDARTEEQQPNQLQRRSNIGRLLARSFEAFQHFIHSGLSANYPDFTSADARLLRNIRDDGSSPTAIAQRTGLTLQGVNQHLKSMSKRGYVAIEVDPRDRRRRIVALTETARQLIVEGQELNRQLDERWSQILGKEEYARLCSDLRSLLGELSRSGEIGPGEHLDG